MTGYKNFEEIGDWATYGASTFHVIDYKHEDDDCIAWQHGIDNLCDWLDKEGYVVVSVPVKPTHRRWCLSLGLLLIRLGERVASLSKDKK